MFLENPGEGQEILSNWKSRGGVRNVAWKSRGGARNVEGVILLCSNRISRGMLK